jgi:flagellar biosynthesis regulator FlaF
MAIRDYHKAQKTIESQRASEYRRLAELTGALIESDKNQRDAMAYANAVRNNQQFWSILRLQLVQANTSLPPELRVQFLSLAEWVEKESALAAAGDHMLEGLIAVNRQIMEGLKPYTGSLGEDTLRAVV